MREHRRSVILIACTLGLAAGAVVGDMVGLALRSDNQPFFIALGVLCGALLGLGAGIAIAVFHR